MPRGRPKRIATNDGNEDSSKVQKVEEEKKDEEEEVPKPPPLPFTDYFLDIEENKQLVELCSNWRFLVVLHFCEHFKEFLSLPSFTTLVN